MFRMTPIAFAMVLSPLASFAQCPSIADLEKGILFKIDTNHSELFRTLPSGVTEAIYSENGQPLTRTMLAKGVYLLELVDLENGTPIADTRVTYSFPQSSADLPDAQPETQFLATAAVLEGGNIRSERQVYNTGPLSSVAIGDCSYEMFTITITYPDDNANNSDVLYYLPALKIAYLAEATYDGNTDKYSYSGIEAVN